MATIKEVNDLFRMGFRFVEGKDYAKAELEDGVCLVVERLKFGGWRCRAAMPAMKGKCISGFAAFTAPAPKDAVEGCIMTALSRLAVKRTSHETEAERLGRAMGILEGAERKTKE